MLFGASSAISADHPAGCHSMSIPSSLSCTRAISNFTSRQVAGQPVDLVHHDDVDLHGIDVSKQAFQGCQADLGWIEFVAWRSSWAP